MQNKKRSKHHLIAKAQKRTKRNKQKFGNRIMELITIAREEAEREAEAKKKQKEALKKGLKKIEVTSQKKKSPQKKGQTSGVKK